MSIFYMLIYVQAIFLFLIHIISMIYIIDVWCGERCFVDCDVLIFALDLRFFMNIGACCCLMVNDIDKIFVINSLQYCGLTECIKTVKNG